MRPLRIASQPFGLIWWFENAVVGTLGGPGQTQDARPQFIIVRLEKARAKDVHLFYLFWRSADLEIICVAALGQYTVPVCDGLYPQI